MTTDSCLKIEPCANLNFKIDLAKEYEKFNSKGTKFLIVERLRSDKKLPVTTIQGEMCTAGINAMEFGQGKQKRQSYSVGLTLDGDGEQTLSDILALVAKKCETVDGDWEICDPVKDDSKLYLKLKTDGSGKKFQFKSNLHITPKKYSEASGAESITFKGEISAWFNMEEKKAGLSFSAKTINFEMGEEPEDDDSPPAKKVKV